MVWITNGVKTFMVSAGAYKSIFANQGYMLVQENGGNKNKNENNGNSEKNSANDPDEQFCMDMEEIPISEWSKEEIKKYAKIKKIDLSGTSNVNEARERVKGYMQ